MKLFPAALGLGVLALVAACDQPPPPQAPPPAVEYVAVSKKPVASVYEFIARTRAREDTAIRAQISGTVVERSFDEGQAVEAGAVLFRIDPRPYDAALGSARAELTRAEAALKVAERNAERADELQPQGFISQAEVDKLLGERDSARAAISSARAAVEQAEINLGYTRVTAPFAGTVGSSSVSIGDLVDPSAGPLVTLVQLDPMLVDFEVDEAALARAMKLNQERAAAGQDPVTYTPMLQLVTGDTYPEPGEIDYANNRVNPSTGTITVTTRFPNPDGVLVPGQFARVRLQRGSPEEQLLVPQAAVLEDMQGRYVFVIQDDDTVARRNVTLGQREGIDWVVQDGLTEGDRVIVNGVQKVRPGMPVAGTPVS